MALLFEKYFHLILVFLVEVSDHLDEIKNAEKIYHIISKLFFTLFYIYQQNLF